MAISSLVTGPLSTTGSVNTRRPPGASTRAQSASTRPRSGRWLMTSTQRSASKPQASKGNLAVASTHSEDSPIYDIARSGAGAGGRHRKGVHVNAVNPTTGLYRQAQRRTAGSAADVEQPRGCAEAQPGDEQIMFLDGEPTVLSDVLTEGLRAYRRRELRFERLVDAAVMLAPVGLVADLCSESTVGWPRIPQRRRSLNAQDPSGPPVDRRCARSADRTTDAARSGVAVARSAPAYDSSTRRPERRSLKNNRNASAHKRVNTQGTKNTAVQLVCSPLLKISWILPEKMPRENCLDRG